MSGKIIAAGHICLDITPVFPPEKKTDSVSSLLVPGKLINVGRADVHTGGSVANTGLALKLLGNDVKLLGKVGNDEFGSLLRELALSYGADGLIVDESSSTSYSVVLALPGLDRIFLHDPGANDEFTASDIPDEALSDCLLFHFGYPPIMKRMFYNGGAELIKIFKRAKEQGCVTSLDLAAVDPDSEAGRADWANILASVLPYVDLFLPSFEELCFMLDREKYEALSEKGGDMAEEIDIMRDAMPLCEKCIELGAAVAVIKCGTAGLCYKTAGSVKLSDICEGLPIKSDDWAEKSGTVPCYKPDILRSATGAGDTSIAAFLTAAVRGKSIEDAVRLAAAEGAASVTAYDALGGLLGIEALEKKIKEGWEVL